MTPTNAEALAAELDEFDNHNETDQIAYRAADELRRLQAENAELRAERDALRAELESERQWGRLWYFVCDEAPLAFEKIVCEHTPSRWIQEAHKLRAAMKGTQ